MKLSHLESIKEAKRQLKRKGYDDVFKLINNRMYSIKKNITYHPEDMYILEIHRFGKIYGANKDISIFAVLCNDGNKGLIISSYDVSFSQDLIKFIDQINELKVEVF